MGCQTVWIKIGRTKKINLQHLATGVGLKVKAHLVMAALERVIEVLVEEVAVEVVPGGVLEEEEVVGVGVLEAKVLVPEMMMMMMEGIKDLEAVGEVVVLEAKALVPEMMMMEEIKDLEAVGEEVVLEAKALVLEMMMEGVKDLEVVGEEVEEEGSVQEMMKMEKIKDLEVEGEEVVEADLAQKMTMMMEVLLVAGEEVRLPYAQP